MKWLRMILLLGLAGCIMVIGCGATKDPVSSDPPAPLEPFGSLEVLSSPSGATIIFDHDTLGTTPDTITQILAGHYNVQLNLERYYDFSTYVRIDSGLMASVNQTLSVTCTGMIIGDLNQPPEIDFIDLEPGDRNIYGVANNVDAGEIRVVLWALTNRWYVQPLISNPYTSICDDGTWDNWTHGWGTMVAVLVDSTYVPGSIRYTHPGFDQGVLAFAQYPPIRPDLPIEFSGYTWGVKQSVDRFDPGPNYWSATVDNIWVDDEGMHLRIFYDGVHWTCPEVYLLESHGYGTYTFELASRVDNLDQRAVLGCFTYESTSRELDIEFSHALANPNNAQYVIQPYTHGGNIYQYDMPAVTYSTHQIEWRSDHVLFQSYRGLGMNPDSLITSWNYTGSDIPPENIERWRFNLWLFGGNPPVSGIGDEVIIKSFEYEP
ncbi:MAG: PEGA domain-containing protein [bacterium]|nr:PEGA domain-containing protein [bacterium]